LLIVLPLALLLLDILAYPPIFETRRLARVVDIASILARQVVSLGTFRGHRVYVAIDSLLSGRSMHYLSGSSNALAISHFMSSAAPAPKAGVLGQALLAKLANASPADGNRLRDALAQVGDRDAGHIIELRLNISRAEYRQFPIDYVFILLLDEGPSSDSRTVIAKGIGAILRLTRRRQVHTLLVPCLGYNWEDKNSIDFDAIFEPLLESVPRGGAPRDLYVSLYSGWPTHVLEEAVRLLNTAWERKVLSAPRPVPSLYRGERRVTFAGLAVCLAASALAAPITVRNFLIITTSFLGAALLSRKLTTFLTRGYSPTFRFWISVAVLAAVAILFPVVITWTPKDIFVHGKG